MIGYFPTYTLGDVFAAQLYACAELELGDLGEHFARGEFVALVQWLGRGCTGRARDTRRLG